MASPWGFVNPPDMGFDDWNTFGENSQYREGSVVNLVWRSPPDTPLSLRLYQADLATGEPLEEFEYILQSVINRTDHAWRVATNPDQALAASNVFLLALYQEGLEDVMGTSHYFNISARSPDRSGGGTTTTTTATLPTTSADTGAKTETSTSLGPSKPPPAATSSRLDAAAETRVPTAPDAGGLSVVAKAGIGVAIPLAVVLGLAAGWLLFRRRRGRRDDDDAGGGPPRYCDARPYDPAAASKPGELPGPLSHEAGGENYVGRTDHYELDAQVPGWRG